MVVLLEREGIFLDAIEDLGQKGRIKIRPVLADPAVVADERIFGHPTLLLDRRVVEVRVEHNDGKGQDEGRVGRRKYIGILNRKTLGEIFHDPVDFLGFPRQPKARQEQPDGLGKEHAGEIQGLRVVMENPAKEARATLVGIQVFLALDEGRVGFSSQGFPHLGLVEAVLVDDKEPGDLLGVAAHKAVLDKEAQTLLEIHSELDRADFQVFFRAPFLFEKVEDGSGQVVVVDILGFRSLAMFVPDAFHSQDRRPGHVFPDLTEPGKVRGPQLARGDDLLDVEVAPDLLPGRIDDLIVVLAVGRDAKSLQKGLENPYQDLTAGEAQAGVLVGLLLLGTATATGDECRPCHGRFRAKLGQVQDNVLVEVLRVHPAIVVQEYLGEQKGVLAQRPEGFQHQRLLGKAGVLRFDDPEENIGHEGLHFVLDVVLELVAHDQKDLLADVGHLGARGHAVLEKRDAPVLRLNQLDELVPVAKDGPRALDGPAL
mmetsp:Transcript_116924/g.239219  ORF Transcript_116924/g.239219 Transcript_116924/m.239219 type:complete len:485 (+) Transcript_116924:5104-6558(+)